MGWFGDTFGGITGKISNAYHSVSDSAKGIGSKIASAAKTVGHHAMDGLKTAGHVMAHHAPALLGAAVGALGNSLVPGVGALAGKTFGEAIGRKVKNWHSTKYGKHVPDSATGRAVRQVSKVGKAMNRISRNIVGLPAKALKHQSSAGVVPRSNY
jgi:hypothetical protein